MSISGFLGLGGLVFSEAEFDTGICAPGSERSTVVSLSSSSLELISDGSISAVKSVDLSELVACASDFAPSLFVLVDLRHLILLGELGDGFVNLNEVVLLFGLDILGDSDSSGGSDDDEFHFSCCLINSPC